MVYEVDEYSGDGMTSNDWMEHHGIPNQRWGVRNGPPYPIQRGHNVRYAIGKMTEKTKSILGKDARNGSGSRQERREKKAADKFTKQLREYSEFSRGTQYARLANSKQFKDIAGQVRRQWEEKRQLRKSLDKVENKFFKRPDFDHWVQRAAEEDWKNYNRDGSLEREGWSFQSFLDWYRNDDGDQGDRTTRSFDMWLKESGEKEASDYLKNEDRMIQADKKYTADCKKAIQSYMGEHGNETYKIQYRWGSNVSTYQRELAEKGQDIVNRIMNTWDTFGDDFDTPVSIETYKKLLN